MPPLRDRIFSLAGTEMVELPALPQHYSRTQVAIKTCTHFVQNNKQKIVIVLLFFYLCSVIFSERFYSESQLSIDMSVQGPLLCG